MAHQHDGYFEMHGQWAVERKLPIWKQQFVDFGLKESQLDAVAFETHWHCKDFSTVPHSTHLEMFELLQDADALDSVRFSGPETIRLDYLHFSETKEEISYSERMFFFISSEGL